jgi:hypothetical protein
MDGVAAGLRLWSVFLAWGVTAASLVAAYLLAASHGGAVWWILAWALPTLGCASVGVLLCVRVSRNPISWLVLVLGVSQAVAYLGDAYSAAALKLPGAAASAAAASLIEGLPPFVFVPALLLLFPDGRLPSRGWRPVAMFAAAAASVGLMAGLLASGSLGAALLGLASVGTVPLSSVSNVAGTLAWVVAATLSARRPERLGVHSAWGSAAPRALHGRIRSAYAASELPSLLLVVVHAPGTVRAPGRRPRVRFLPRCSGRGLAGLSAAV